MATNLGVGYEIFASQYGRKQRRLSGSVARKRLVKT
jgi:hypothetical protein